MEELTPRQQEVIRLIAKGLTHGQIAEHMGISLAGAKWHVGEVLSKYGVDSREEAVRVWKRERSVGARLGRMAAALPFPKVVAAGGAAVAGLAALVVVVAVVVSGGNASSDGDLTARQALTGSPVSQQVSVYYPEHFANSVTRLVIYHESPGLDPMEEEPGNASALSEWWAERDREGRAAVLYVATFDEGGEITRVTRIDGDDSMFFEPHAPDLNSCLPHAERFPGDEPQPIGEGSLIGLPGFLDRDALGSGGMTQTSDALTPVSPLPEIDTYAGARERWVADFSRPESWTGPVGDELPPGTLTFTFDASGLLVTGLFDAEGDGVAIPTHFLLTEVFDLDVGIELRKQVIPWEEWCPE